MTESDGRRRPELDGLRALACLAVLLWHAGISWLPGGFIGVDVFFVLSGYLITATLIREHERSGAIRLRAFYARRARRLFPALGVMLLAVTIYSATNAGESWATSQSLRGLPFVLTYVGNWALTFHWVAGSMGMLGHTWTLAVEEQFYLIWPLVLIVGLRTMTRRHYGRAATVLLALALAEGAVRGYLVAASNADTSFVKYNPYVGYFSTIGHSDGLLMGAALAFWLAGGHQFSARTLSLLARIGAAILVASVALIQSSSLLPAEGLRVVINAATACTIAAMVGAGTGLIRAVLGSRPIAYIGRISYSLYLWHYPLFIAIGSIPFFATYHGWYWVAKFTVPFVVAALSYRFVEQPFLRKNSRVADPIPATMVNSAPIEVSLMCK